MIEEEVAIALVWQKSVWSVVCADSSWILKQHGGRRGNHLGEWVRSFCKVGKS